MPRGVPKSASATSVPSASTRATSARSAKIKANMSLMDHADADYDRLIRKHAKMGARGFAKQGRETASTSTAKMRTPMSPITTTTSNKGKAPAKKRDDSKERQEGDVDATGNDMTSAIKETTANVSTAKRRAKKKTKAKETEADARDDGAMVEVVMDVESEDKSEEPSSSTRKIKKATTAAKSTKKAAATKVSKTKAPSSKPAPKSRKKNSKTEEADPVDDVMTDVQGPEQGDVEHLAGITTPEKGKAKAAGVRKGKEEQHKSDRQTTASSSSSTASPKKERRTKMSPQKAARSIPVMSEVQVQSFLANYDLEAENRIRIATKTLQISIDSARTQMHAKAIAKLPRAVRLMKLSDFVHEYGADVQAALERAAVTANKVREGEWEEEKLQRKRKDADEAGDGDVARGKEKTQKVEKEKQTAAGAKRMKGRVVSASTSRRAAPSKVPVLSPVRQASSVQPPTAASFAPRLAPSSQASSMPPPLATPARGTARVAKTGEQVQYLSLNGSPIIGVIAPDGTVHAMPRTVGSPTKRKFGTARAEVQEDEEDAAETSAHLLELALGIDEQQKKRNRTQKVPSESPASQSSMHTAPGTRRPTIDAESDDGADVFEEALSLPDDDAGSLPDEEAYTAQILREEAERRERARASTAAPAARSSSSIGNSSNAGATAARNSAATIRPNALQRKALVPAATNAGGRHASQIGSSSPMIKSRLNAGFSSGSERVWRPQMSTAAPASSSSSSSGPTPSSSAPSKGRVSIVFGSGSQQQITHLGVEDLMRLPSHERTQMLEILEKLRKTQRASAD